MDQFDGNVWSLRRLPPKPRTHPTTDASSKAPHPQYGGRQEVHRHVHHRQGSERQMAAAGRSGEQRRCHVSGKDRRRQRKRRRRIPDPPPATRSSTTTRARSRPSSPAGLSTGMTYTESGIIAPTPTDKEIAKANAAVTDQPGTKDVPDSVGKFASSVAGGEDTAGAQAQALVAQLKDSGWFSHGLTGDYPSLPGHGSYRINALLAGSAMVGDSEQYASAMALMARELGLPSAWSWASCPRTTTATSATTAPKRSTAPRPSNSPATTSKHGWRSISKDTAGSRSIRRLKRRRYPTTTKTSPTQPADAGPTASRAAHRPAARRGAGTRQIGAGRRGCHR